MTETIYIEEHWDLDAWQRALDRVRGMAPEEVEADLRAMDRRLRDLDRERRAARR